MIIKAKNQKTKLPKPVRRSKKSPSLSQSLKAARATERF